MLFCIHKLTGTYDWLMFLWLTGETVSIPSLLPSEHLETHKQTNCRGTGLILIHWIVCIHLKDACNGQREAGGTRNKQELRETEPKRQGASHKQSQERVEQRTELSYPKQLLSCSQIQPCDHTHIKQDNLWWSVLCSMSYCGCARFINREHYIM